jgi:hypothetical protein
MTDNIEGETRMQFFVRSLIDWWNVGVRKGEIKDAGVDRWEISRIQNILQKLGITVCLENIDAIREIHYDGYTRKETTHHVKFIMTEVTEKTVKYPF